MSTKSDCNWIAFDFETSGQNKYACTIELLVWGSDTDGINYDWSLQGDRKIYQHVRKVVERYMRSSIPKVAHNAPFDLYLMEARLGIPVRGEIHDTYLMAKHWRNDLPAYDLKSLSWLIFGDLYAPLTELRKWIHEHNEQGEDDIEFDMTRCPDRLVLAYCQHDVKMTLRLAEFLWPKVGDNPAYRQDAELIRRVMQMEAVGMKADVPFYRDFIRRGWRRVRYNTRRASDELKVADGRKPTGLALREHLGKRGEQRKTPKGMVRADDVVLRDHKASAAVRAVQRVRSDQKVVATYAENILKVVNAAGVFHPGLHQSAAVTRRFRASGLYGDNGVIAKGQVQNFPRGEGVRSGIVVPPGFKFVKMDLASIEARLGCHAMSVFLGFDFYCKMYREDPDFNLYLYVVEHHTDHGKVTKKDPIYTAYKHGCLGVQYGVGIDTFHRTMVEKFDLPYSFDECNAIYDTIRDRCPEFSQLQRAVSAIVERQGFISDDFGDPYYVPENERYKGVNYYCQGCAGSVLKWWWLRVAEMMESFDEGDYLFNTVHDELDGAIRNNRGARKRVKAYCDVLKELDLFDLPIVAEASGLVDNWGEAG